MKILSNIVQEEVPDGSSDNLYIEAGDWALEILNPIDVRTKLFPGVDRVKLDTQVPDFSIIEVRNVVREGLEKGHLLGGAIARGYTPDRHLGYDEF